MNHVMGKAIIVYANSKGSGEPAHSRSLARTFAVRSRKLYAKEKVQSRNWTCCLAKGPRMHAQWNIDTMESPKAFFSQRGSYVLNVQWMPEWMTLDLKPARAKGFLRIISSSV